MWISNLDLAFISVPHFLKVRIFTGIHPIPDFIIVFFAKFLAKLTFIIPNPFQYLSRRGNRQSVLHAIHESLLPLGIGHVGRDIVNFPISVPGGSFTVHIIKIGASGSPAIRVERGDSHAGFKLGQRDHHAIKGLANLASVRIQRFQNFNLFNPQILIGLLGGNSVEVAGFRMHQPPRLIAGNIEPLLNCACDLLWTIATQKPLCQFFLNISNQFRFLDPNAVTESSSVRCPRF